MKFYNRTNEIQYLQKVTALSKQSGQFTIITGRRRVGKTALCKHVFENEKNYFYFFVTRKKSKALLDDFSEILQEKIPVLTDKFQTWEAFVKFLFEYSKTQNITVIFDEFQNFKFVDPSMFSIMQKYIDSEQKHVQLNLICIGSIFTLMEEIFSSSKEPLFGRPNHKIALKPFPIETVRKIIKDHNNANYEEFLNFYSVFGGIAKYYSEWVNLQKTGANLNFWQMIEEMILSEFALLKNEGEELTKEEFGNEYQTNFSILQAIASGKTKPTEIADFIQMPVTSISRYLSKLLKYYKIIGKNVPIMNTKSKDIRYYIKDYFLRFWFKYVYKNLSYLESGKTKKVLKLIKDDFRAFQGNIFEDIVQEDILRDAYLDIDYAARWWNRQGDEIAIVGISEKKTLVIFGECKLNPKKITYSLLEDLKKKSQKFPWNIHTRKEKHALFTVGKIEKNLKQSLHKEGVIVREYI